jgi:hypothetical protein
MKEGHDAVAIGSGMSEESAMFLCKIVRFWDGNAAFV